MIKRSKISIEEIFNFFRSGNNQRGVELLYKNNYGKMYGVAFSIAKNEDVSKDIVHNVIYKLLKLDKSKFPRNYELTWLYKVTKNEALNYLKSNQKYIPLDDILINLEEDINIRELVDMDAYYSMIKGLSDDQKEVVTLKVLGDYTHKEIAEILNKPVGTIQWIYNTSIKKLKIILSSMLTVFVLSLICTTQRLCEYINNVINSSAAHPGGADFKVPFDPMIAIFGALATIAVIAFIIIFKKSDKIPTKTNIKNI